MQVYRLNLEWLKLLITFDAFNELVMKEYLLVSKLWDQVILASTLQEEVGEFVLLLYLHFCQLTMTHQTAAVHATK